ncbi:hypothetical protein J6590_011142 [Homalodisca vitripennis]|nr:hypothetical protein J6590_011142 [Homalodisca vitripennis]
MVHRPSLTLNLGINSLKVTSGPPPMAAQAAWKDRIAQQSPIQAVATLDVALFRYLGDNDCTRYTTPLATPTCQQNQVA